MRPAALMTGFSPANSVSQGVLHPVIGVGHTAGFWWRKSAKYEQRMRARFEMVPAAMVVLAHVVIWMKPVPSLNGSFPAGFL